MKLKTALISWSRSRAQPLSRRKLLRQCQMDCLMPTPSPAPPFRCTGSATLGDAAGGGLTIMAPTAFTVCRGSTIVHGAGIAAGTVDGGTGDDKDKSVVTALPKQLLAVVTTPWERASACSRAGGVPPLPA
jgi:hypothetical protein